MCCHIVAQLQLDSGKQVVKTNSDFLNCGRTRDVVAHLYGKRGHFGLNDADGIGAPYKYKVSCCRLSWHRVHCVARASLETTYRKQHECLGQGNWRSRTAETCLTCVSEVSVRSTSNDHYPASSQHPSLAHTWPDAIDASAQAASRMESSTPTTESMHPWMHACIGGKPVSEQRLR